MSFVRVTHDPHTFCPESEEQASCDNSQQTQPPTENSTTDSPVNGKNSSYECSWPNCCSLRVNNSLLPQIMVNGHQGKVSLMVLHFRPEIANNEICYVGLRKNFIIQLFIKFRKLKNLTFSKFRGSETFFKDKEQFFF